MAIALYVYFSLVMTASFAECKTVCAGFWLSRCRLDLAMCSTLIHFVGMVRIS